MRGSGIIGTIVLVWLLIGVFAAYQRDYFKTTETSCAHSGNHRAHGRRRPAELRGCQPEGGGLQRPTAKSVPSPVNHRSRKEVVMIAIGVILLILGLVFGVPILTYIGVVALVIGAVFWILGCGRARGRRQAGLVLASLGPARAPPASSRAAPRAMSRRRSAPGLTLCGVELSSPKVACAISRASSSSSVGVDVAQHVAPRFRRTAAAPGVPDASRRSGRWARSRSWMRIRSGSPSTKSRWKSIRPSSAAAGRRCAVDDLRGAGEQPGADADQQLDEQRLLVGEVAVDRRAAHPGRRADVLEPHREDIRVRRSIARRRRSVASGGPTWPCCAGSRRDGVEVRPLPPPALVDISVNRH